MIHGFDPIAGPDARVLILGSVPSDRSLAEQRYYAHPRNSFWTIMLSLFGGGAYLDYATCLEMLQRSKVAVWDVLKAAERHGSLDSAIVSATAVPNDIAGFLVAHPQVATVFFNGEKAEALFRKHITPTLRSGTEPRLVRLPSTSPANAAVSLHAKLEQWEVVVAATRS